MSSDLEGLPTTEDIKKLQEEVSKLPQYEPTTIHHFADGMYCRELFRPAGTVVVGKVHRKEHLYMVMTGEVTIVGNGKRERVKAPRVFVCQPGTKRAVYAHEDSICITVHRTSETDLEKIEAELVEDDAESMYLPGNILKHPRIK